MARNAAENRGGDGLLHRDLTERIIGVFFQVHRELGFGFSEAVYSRAMEIALREAGLRTQREFPVAVFFRGKRIGRYRADHLVDSTIMLELKSSERLDPGVEPQLLNLLKGTPVEVRLVLHFGPRAAFKRIIMTNDRKGPREP